MNDAEQQENPLEHAIDKIQSGDWIYFTKKYNDYVNLYKVRSNGKELTFLDSDLCYGITVKNGRLQYDKYSEMECWQGYTAGGLIEYSIPLED